MASGTGTPCAGRSEVWRRFVLEAPLSMVLTDPDCRIIAASPELLAGAGLTIGEIVGRTLFELFPGSEKAISEVAEALASGRPNHTVVRPIESPDGRAKWAKSQSSYWRDDAGAVAGYLFVNQDITAEHEAAIQRQEAESLMRAVLENIPASITVQDVDTEAFLLANRRTYLGIGMSESEVLGKRPVDLFPPETARRMSEHLRTAARTGDIVESEWTVEFGPSRGRTSLVKKVVIEDAGQRHRLLLISEDVTEARRTAEALTRAKEEAEAANRAKSTFLATMSHEIRTPLNGVLGMAQAMAMGDLSLAQRERLDVIRRSGQALLVILNDVLDLSKIEAGKLELESAEFDLEDLARGVHDIFAPAADAKDCRFVLAVEPAAAGIYRGDPTRIRQILYNLVSNALKFTEAGEVRLAISEAPQGLELRVTDSGIGMSEEQIAALFSKFQQADASTTRRFGGTGLGLAICRELATLMGGSISADSRLGEGSTFTVILPALRLRDADAASQAEPAPEPGAASSPPRPALRMLAAEDNKVNQLVLKALLQPIGVEPFVVENGADAVAAWEAGNWDMILMDVQMPRMDGPAATRIIRERERATGRRRTPIIALTANAMAHQVNDYLASGMDGFVAKPIEAERLFEAVDAALATDRAAGRFVG
jgi:PAS domain S-box-containing protein